MHDHVLDAVDEELALNAVRSYRLQFLDDLTGAAHDGLAQYFPATSAGELRPGRGESLYNRRARRRRPGDVPRHR